MEYIKVREIFEKICDSYQIGNGLYKTEKQALRSGMISTLKNKFSVLLSHALARSSTHFKQKAGNSPYRIPARDAPIVYQLLKATVSPNPSPVEELLSIWLTPSGISPDDYTNICNLHFIVNDILDALEQTYEIDEVTHQEWLRAIDISIGFDKAFTIFNSTKYIDSLMTYAAILDIPGNGSVIFSTKNGERSLYKDSDSLFNLPRIIENIEQLPIVKIAEQCDSLEDYSILLQAIFECLQRIIYHKTYHKLCTLAKLKCPRINHIEDQFHTTEQLASEYYTYYRNIYNLLKKDSKLCDHIESTTGINDLLDFFYIESSLPKHLKKQTPSSCPEKIEKEFSDAQEDKSQTSE